MAKTRSWLGKWRNQYGSILEITDEADHRIVGTFRSPLGQDLAIFGFHQGDCLGLTGGAIAPSGDIVVTYTGLMRDGKLETLWHPPARAAKPSGHWRSLTGTTTSADTFERVS